jgi:hypothetical protein
VGSGSINVYRKDLDEAGLGDGYLGFGFNITLPKPGDALRVTVTLEACEAMILQPDSIVLNKRLPRPAGSFVGGVLAGSEKLEWMVARGWLDARRSEDLETVKNFGVLGLSLDPARDKAETVALAFLESAVMGPVELGRIECDSPEDLREALFAEGADCADAGLFVLTSDQRISLRVVETPHCGPESVTTFDLVGAVDYPLDQRTIAVVRRWVPFAAVARVAGAARITAFYPKVIANRTSAETETAGAISA